MSTLSSLARTFEQHGIIASAMTENDPDDTREFGIEFGNLVERLESADFPISHERLMTQYGDHQLQLSDETVTIEELLGPASEEEYEDTESIRQSILNMVGDEAIGRKEYSDRGVPSLSEDRQDESL